MNYRIITIILLSISFCTEYAFGMDNPISEESTLSVLRETSQGYDTFQRDCAEKIKKVAMEAPIKKRKFFNIMYAMTILTMMGIDLANSYWDEKGLLKQMTTDFGYYGHPCECPNATSYCLFKDYYQNFDHECMLSSGGMLLYAINDGITSWRFYSSFIELYRLYQVQQALNRQLVSEDAITQEEIDASYRWRGIRGLSAIMTGVSTGLAGIINGITSYPRSVSIWSVNAAVDILSALNWHGNMKTCEEMMK